MVAAVVGAAVAVHYHRLGLTLSHYDARGHLVVARRIVDSLTPGWQQIGAVWLPLPHLLNALPVQVDLFYRTGASAVAISISAFAAATASLAWIVRRLTGSAMAAVAGAAVFAANPNVLYLQSTPMTEPLLLGLTTLSVALLIRWLDGEVSAAAPGWTCALACLTRYEAWPVTACAIGATTWVLWRRGESAAAALWRVGAIAVYPAIAGLAFMIFSRATVGEWFIASGFFVPENKSLGKPILAAAEIWWGTHELSGNVTIALAAAGLAALFVRGLFVRRGAESLVALALGATAALPWSAFLKGHPFRIRYMVPLVALEAIGAGVVLAMPLAWIERRWPRALILRAALAGLAIATLVFELQPLDARAPMVVEAQWDRPNISARRHVTDCLRRAYADETIMASMGSLGHYMQETSRAGFHVADFLHEGNGDLWLAALEGPRPYAGWLLIEEKAEGGDMLARRAREDPTFLDGFARVCEGAGVALYRRR